MYMLVHDSSTANSPTYTSGSRVMADSDTVLRIRLALAAEALNEAALARKLGISKQSLSNIMSDRQSGQSHFKSIAKALNVDVMWLTTGKGIPPLYARETPIDPSKPEDGADPEVWRTIAASQKTLSELMALLREENARNRRLEEEVRALREASRRSASDEDSNSGRHKSR